MASRWLRLACFCGWNGAEGFRIGAYKFLPFFLRYVAGYTFQSESVAGGNSFFSYEKTGTTGSFSGTSFVFTGTGFASTDVYKYLFVRDDSNDINCGCYPITRYVSPTQIWIDFGGFRTQFPSAGSNISWWIVSDSYQRPVAHLDWCRLQSPAGWAIQWYVVNPFGDQQDAGIITSLDGTWGTRQINIYGSPYGLIFNNGGGPQSQRIMWHLEAEKTGSYLILFDINFYTQGANPSWYFGYVSGYTMSAITPIGATAYSPYELWSVAHGNTDRGWIARNASNAATLNWYDFGCRYVWDEKAQVARRAAFLEPTYSTVANSCSRWTGREHNRRLRSLGALKLECLDGTPIIVDAGVEGWGGWAGDMGIANYNLRGVDKSHVTIPETVPCLQLLTQTQPGDLIHLRQGIALRWPSGVSHRWYYPERGNSSYG